MNREVVSTSVNGEVIDLTMDHDTIVLSSDGDIEMDDLSDQENDIENTVNPEVVVIDLATDHNTIVLSSDGDIEMNDLSDQENDIENAVNPELVSTAVNSAVIDLATDHNTIVLSSDGDIEVDDLSDHANDNEMNGLPSEDDTVNNLTFDSEEVVVIDLTTDSEVNFARTASVIHHTRDFIQNVPQTVNQVGAGDSGTYISVMRKYREFNHRFNYTRLGIDFVIKEPTSNTGNWLHAALEEVLQIIQTETNPGEKVLMTLSLKDNPNHRPIFISARPHNALTIDTIFDELEKVQQSTSVFSTTDELEVQALIFHAMQGRGNRRKPSRMTLDELRVNKNRSIIDVTTEKNCLPIAIFFGKLLIDHTDNPEYRKNTIKNLKRHSTKLNYEAEKLAKTVMGTDFNIDGEYGLDFITKFSLKYNDFRITVYSNLDDHSEIIFKTRKNIKNQNKVINLFYDNDKKHYFCIRSVTGFFGFRRQCSLCDDLYNNLPHKCSEVCPYCKTASPCPSVDKMIDCTLCNRIFRGENCKAKHLESGTCSKVKMCKDCLVTYDTKDNHRCNFKKCKICYKYCEIPHYCHMQPYKKSPPKKYCLIFYDLESQFEPPCADGYSKHNPNLCIAYTVCNDCAPHSDTPCRNPGKTCGQQIFESDDNQTCVQKFVDYVLKFRDMPTRVIAHNAKGYDGQFILSELGQRDHKISPILSGSKILCATVGDIVFIDSLCFLPFPLSQFGSAFGIPEAKGYYPYKFNTRENRDYVGPYPSMDMYPIATMTTKQYNEFEIWYNVNKNRNFDNRAELIRYCEQDIKILVKGCLIFMFDSINKSSINPFLECVTIADSVMKVFRKNYLKPGTLGITPKNNYNSKNNKKQSVIGLQWLIHLRLNQNLKLEHEFEIKSTQYVADGYDRSSNTVYSFEGCYYHGHTCFLNRDYVCSSDPNDTIQSRYEATLKRLDHIRKLGYNVVSVWECDFTKYLKLNREIKSQIEKDPEFLRGVFNPRDAVYGGRTEAFRTYYKCRPGERGHFLDFRSLYSDCNKNGKYFIDHPLIFNDFPDPNDALQYDGIVKCTILPPRGLYSPLLPYRWGKKLIFPLCRKCVEHSSKETCRHSNVDRALTGTWCLDEVRDAVVIGYQLVEVFEVWSYDTTQYDPQTKEGGLFVDFVNNFLKIKQEASGFPNNVQTPAQKEIYVQEFLEKEGIHLELDKIAENKGLRSLAKLMLNSLWGRFIMRDDFNTTTICNTAAELNELLVSESIELMNVFSVGPTQIYVSWRSICESETPSKYVNLGVGICTTTTARLKLYKVLSKLGRNILYCDTDSVMYIVPKGEQNPLQTGNFIGELTDELAAYGEGAYIDEFVCTGPKAYAIKIYCPKTKSYSYKVAYKGITMNREVEKKLNFDTIKDIVLNPEKSIKINYCDRIQRRKKFEVVSGPASKTAKFTFDKRQIVDNFDTVPYGF